MPSRMTSWREFAARHPDTARGMLLFVILAAATPVAGHYVYWRFVAVFYIGALVGMGELVARYRDAPQSALWTWAAALYVAINALAAIVALYVVQVFHIAESPDALKTRITHIFLAGFGAMGFFRSSVFTVRVGEQDVAIGPVAFLQVVLRATDRAVDRVRAKARAETVTTAMNGVSFDRAHAALPAFCLALMQNVSAEEEKDIGDGVKVLQGAALDNDTKAKNLALMLLNVIGENVLVTAIGRFGQQLQKTEVVVIGNGVATIAAGGTQELTATCADHSGAVVPGRRPDWSSDDPTIATITAGGNLTGVKAGTTVIRAKSDDAETTLLLTVN
jgi:hypothetical protein